MFLSIPVSLASWVIAIILAKVGVCLFFSYHMDLVPLATPVPLASWVIAVWFTHSNFVHIPILFSISGKSILYSKSDLLRN